MGAPVIVADAGAASETVLAPPDVDESARTGWRTPPGAEALANALRAALSLGATARDRLSLRARAHVEARFSIEQTWAQTLGAYAAARGRRPLIGRFPQLCQIFGQSNVTARLTRIDFGPQSTDVLAGSVRRCDRNVMRFA